jgi:hypothetical protein
MIHTPDATAIRCTKSSIPWRKWVTACLVFFRLFYDYSAVRVWPEIRAVLKSFPFEQLSVKLYFRHSSLKKMLALQLLTFFFKFCVFHVRALYHTKTLITNKCTKRVFINRNTLLHVSTLLGHLQGELSVTVTLGLHFTVEWVHSQQHVLTQQSSATLV